MLVGYFAFSVIDNNVFSNLSSTLIAHENENEKQQYQIPDTKVFPLASFVYISWNGLAFYIYFDCVIHHWFRAAFLIGFIDHDSL